jgi:hypothetical protein
MVMEQTGDTFARALSRLGGADDSVRAAIGEDLETKLRQSLGTR